MLAFIIRRLLQAILVMLTVAFRRFPAVQYVGDPVNQMLGQDATPEDRARLRADLGLDKPFYYQFGHFIGNVVARGLRPEPAPGPERLVADQGTIAGHARTVVHRGADRAWWPASRWAVYTALRRNSWFAQFLLAASLVGISLRPS